MAAPSDSNKIISTEEEDDNGEPLLLLESFINSTELAGESNSVMDYLTSDLPLNNSDLSADLQELAKGFSMQSGQAHGEKSTAQVPEGTWDFLAELDPFSSGFKQTLKCGQAI